MRLILLTLIFLFSACSTNPPKNKWQYEACAAQGDYQKHFLQNRRLRASSDLFQARESALQSANLRIIIDIELSVCALNISILKNDNCEKAQSLLELEPNAQQSAYLHFLQKNYAKEEISLLPKAYQNLAEANLKKEEINPLLVTLEPLSSRAVASALFKKQLHKQNIQDLIDELSFYGYKSPIIAWLKYQIQETSDIKEKKRLQAKLKILTFN